MGVFPSLPIAKGRLKALSNQLEPNTPVVENPLGSGVLVDPMISIAISLKRIADVMEKQSSE